MEKGAHDMSQFEMFTSEMHREFQMSCRGVGDDSADMDRDRGGGEGFTRPRNLSLMVGSWNVNAKEEESHLLSRWLRVSDVLSADLCVIGLQEVIALSASNTVIGSTNNFTGSSDTSDNSSSISYYCCERWLSKLLAHLNQDEAGERASSPSRRRFSLLSQLSMVGLSIFVFVREDIRGRVGGVQARSIARGGGGLLGNKGAVCVRLEVDSTSFCFCSAHLCAHREDVLKRNEDFRLIYNTPVFQSPAFSTIQRMKSEACRSSRNTSVAAAASHLRVKLTKERRGGGKERDIGDALVEEAYLKRVKDHDVVFIFGDLNYRVAEGFEIKEVYDVLEMSEGCLMSELNSVLLDMDQLRIEQREGRAFQDFQEAPIAFKPTYQYVAGTDEYDRRPDRKLRCPGWCDRILWKTSRQNSSSLFFRGEQGLKEQNGQEREVIGGGGKGQNQHTPDSFEEDMDYVKAISYERCENTISDHKPIAATFRLCTLRLDEANKQRALQRVVAAWRRGDMTGTRAVEVSPRCVALGGGGCSEASCRASVTAAITITNPTVMLFSVTVVTPPWLAITGISPESTSPQTGALSLLPMTQRVCEFTINFEAAKQLMPAPATAAVAAAAAGCVDLSSYLQFTIKEDMMAEAKEARGQDDGGCSGPRSRIVEVPVVASFLV